MRQRNASLVVQTSTLPYFSATPLWSGRAIRLVARLVGCRAPIVNFVGTIGFLLRSNSVTIFQEIRIPCETGLVHGSNCARSWKSTGGFHAEGVGNERGFLRTRQWYEKFLPLMKQYFVVTAAFLRKWKCLDRAIENVYPCAMLGKFGIVYLYICLYYFKF